MFSVHKQLEVQSCLASLETCEHSHTLYKTGTLLDWNRILGLALEQALLWYVATGTCANSVKTVLVRGVKSSPNAHTTFDIAVELDDDKQEFIEHIANDIFHELMGRNFMCTLGVDVPYTAVGGHGLQRHHDILGTFCASDDADFIGLSFVEVFLTKGSWNGPAVLKKKKMIRENFVNAGSMIKRQLLCVVTYKTLASGRFGHRAITWFLLSDGQWSLAFTRRLKSHRGALADALHSRIVAKVKPAKTVSGQAVYDLRAVLTELGYLGWTGPVAKRLKKSGVPGIKQLSFKKRGGVKKGQLKRRLIWTITAAGLKRATPHLKAKRKT